MHAGRPAARIAAAYAATALAAAACAGPGRSGITGEVVVSGSSTVEPITVRAAEKFAARNRSVKMSVDGPGTGDGFELFCNGEIDIADASRPIDPREEAGCRRNGVRFIELKIAIDGLSVITSLENDRIECLGFEDLYALLGIESQGFGNWSDANGLGRDLEASHAPYPDMPLIVTAPGEESGTFDSFAEIVLEDIAYEVRGRPEDSPVVRPDYQSSSNDSVIIEGVAGTPSSLGWVGFAFFDNNRQAVKALAIENDSEECVEPTADAIRSGEYPIARDLFIYVNKGHLRKEEALEAFVDYYLSPEGLVSVTEAGYVPLAPRDVKATQRAWREKFTGSRAA